MSVLSDNMAREVICTFVFRLRVSNYRLWVWCVIVRTVIKLDSEINTRDCNWYYLVSRI